MRLNLGCGVHYAPGWTNVDLYEDDKVGDGRRKPDVIADLRSLPFSDHSADLIYMGHVLEHLPEAHVIGALREARRVLKLDGELMIVVPDIQKAREQGLTNIIESIEGRPSPGDTTPECNHQWSPTEARALSLARFVFEAEAVDIGSVGEPWPIINNVSWQSAIRCLARRRVAEPA